MPSSPSDLFAFDFPKAQLTLLDTSDSDDEEVLYLTTLRVVAPAFVPKPKPQVVSLVESHLIQLADGSTVVLRPARGPPSRSAILKAQLRRPISSILRPRPTPINLTKPPPTPEVLQGRPERL